MALRNPCFKDQIGLIWEGGKTVRRERERKEEEEEEEDGGAKIKPTRYGTTWTSNALNGSPCLYSH